MTAAPCSAEAARRRRISTTATRWVGTPYRHGASRRGAGCDCLGLVRGVWREVLGREPERPPAYAPDWAEARGGDPLGDAMRRNFRAVGPEAARFGDVVLLRMRARGPASHLGVLILGEDDDLDMVHAWSGRGVVTSAFGAIWRRRLVEAFTFPE